MRITNKDRNQQNDDYEQPKQSLKIMSFEIISTYILYIYCQQFNSEILKNLNLYQKVNITQFLEQGALKITKIANKMVYRCICLYVQDCIIIGASKHMHSCESEQWQKVTPLLYSFLAKLPAPRFASITTTTLTRNPDTSLFKFDEYRAILAGQSQANNGLLSINNLLIPKGGQIDDVRFKPMLNTNCQLNFESQVTHFGECMRNQSQSVSSGFLVVSQRKNTQIYIYESIALQKCRDKQSINPRMMLKGNETEITSMRCRRNDILNCSKNGDVRMHTLPHGDPSVTYKYHRDPVNDCCWLTSQDDSEFLTASSDGIIYIWDKRSSLPVSKIEPKQGELYCLQPVKDRCFLSGGKDGTIKLYDVRGGVNKFYTFKDHTAPIAFIKKLQGKDGESDHPHQSIFVSGAANGEVFIWGEQLEFTHLGHSSEIKSISYEHSMDLFMTVQKRSPALSLWRPAIFDFQ